jgi:hypothetical protein
LAGLSASECIDSTLLIGSGDAVRSRGPMDERQCSVKMRKLAVLPVLAGSAVVTSVALGAGPASAGTGNPPDCPTPTVSAVLTSALSASGATVSISGKNFGCHEPAGKAIPVAITFYNGPLASRNNLWSTTVSATNGSFSVSRHLPASGVSADSATEVLAQTTAGTSLSSTTDLSQGSGGSLSVPAGHVDVASGGPSDLDVALILVAGGGLVATGLTLAGRRRLT